MCNVKIVIKNHTGREQEYRYTTFELFPVQLMKDKTKRR